MVLATALTETRCTNGIRAIDSAHPIKTVAGIASEIRNADKSMIPTFTRLFAINKVDNNL